MSHSPADYRLLIVDDEQDVREFLSYNLSREGYEVYTASDGREAVEVASEKLPHLIIMDVMMPIMDGMEACSEIRSVEHLRDTLICFLTARGEDYSQIAGFEAGADDYIVKPVKPKVLVHRVKALLKRFRDTSAMVVVASNGEGKGVFLDRERYIIMRDGDEIIVPKKEFELLGLLMSRPGKVFTREEIYSKVWGNEVIVGERTIDVHIRKLRERLGEKYIQTLKGVGYKFTDES